MEVGTDEFGKMYQMYFDDVLRAVYHRISDRQTAEDITQDTFVADVSSTGGAYCFCTAS